MQVNVNEIYNISSISGLLVVTIGTILRIINTQTKLDSTLGGGNH